MGGSSKRLSGSSFEEIGLSREEARILAKFLEENPEMFELAVDEPANN